MVIVIKGADFSANNVGQVLLPISWDTDALAYTAKIPTAFAAMTDAKKRALNKFFKSLKSAGIYSKITNLYLPVFGQSEGGVNLITPTQNISLPMASTTATYSTKGVNFLLGWQVPFTMNTANVHAGAYNTTAAPDIDQLRVSLAVDNNNFFVGRRIASPRLAGLLLNATLQRPNVSNHMSTIGPVIGSSNASLNATGVLVDTEYAGIAQAYAGASSVAFKLGGNTAGTNTGNTEVSYGLFTFGTYLNQTELMTYGALQTTLINTLLA